MVAQTATVTYDPGTTSVADLTAADFRKVLEDLEARTPVEESVAP